jgi:hypothetical protein
VKCSYLELIPRHSVSASTNPYPCPLALVSQSNEKAGKQPYRERSDNLQPEYRNAF